MITLNINLAKFEHIVREIPNKSGQKEKCIIIPIERNSLLLTDKGNVFCNAKMIFIKPENRKGDNTHMIIQGYSKEKEDQMKAAGVKSPIIGNGRDWYDGGNAQSEQVNTSTDFSNEPTDIDSLPF